MPISPLCLIHFLHGLSISRRCAACEQADEVDDGGDAGTVRASSQRNGERREKSLGLLSQKFVQLFLVSPTKVVSLEEAAKILLGHCKDPAKLKTKVRRLYDIANILASLCLIEKTHLTDSRKPAFTWLFSEETVTEARSCLRPPQAKLCPPGVPAFEPRARASSESEAYVSACAFLGSPPPNPCSPRSASLPNPMGNGLPPNNATARDCSASPLGFAMASPQASPFAANSAMLESPRITCPAGSPVHCGLLGAHRRGVSAPTPRAVGTPMPFPTLDSPPPPIGAAAPHRPHSREPPPTSTSVLREPCAAKRQRSDSADAEVPGTEDSLDGGVSAKRARGGTEAASSPAPSPSPKMPLVDDAAASLPLGCAHQGSSVALSQCAAMTPAMIPHRPYLAHRPSSAQAPSTSSPCNAHSPAKCLAGRRADSPLAASVVSPVMPPSVSSRCGGAAGEPLIPLSHDLKPPETPSVRVPTVLHANFATPTPIPRGVLHGASSPVPPFASRFASPANLMYPSPTGCFTPVCSSMAGVLTTPSRVPSYHHATPLTPLTGLDAGLDVGSTPCATLELMATRAMGYRNNSLHSQFSHFVSSWREFYWHCGAAACTASVGKNVMETGAPHHHVLAPSSAGPSVMPIALDTRAISRSPT